MEEQTVRHEHSHSDPKPEPAHQGGEGVAQHVRLVSVSAPGHDVDALLAVIGDVDERLRERYGESSEPLGPRAA